MYLLNLRYGFILDDYLGLFIELNVSVEEDDLVDVLPQEPIDEDYIIGLRWEDIAPASTGICSVDVLVLCTITVSVSFSFPH